MLLFLDVISPIPEFSIIEDNKIIFKKKIIKDYNEKVSDNIIQVYKNIDKNLNLTKNLRKISLTMGPGSYTSLRVGASFISALYLSKNILFYPFTIKDLLEFKSKNQNKEKLGIFLISSNKQKFFCKLNKLGNIDYSKVDNDSFCINNQIEQIYYNYKKLEVSVSNLAQSKFSFVDELLKNNNNVSFNKEEIVKPIFISDNKILN